MGKRLGQHFLESKRCLRRIAGALELEPGDTVVEIGPGHGELTKELLALSPSAVSSGPNCFELLEGKQETSGGIHLVAIEKDRELATLLKEKFHNSNVEVIEGDALKILPKLIRNLKLARPRRASGEAGEIRNSDYKIVGNIPFYLTGRLLRVVSELEPKPACAVFTVQREVAERIVAQPPKMNLLAASVQFWAEPEIIGYIPKTAFHPQPRVDSAIIKLVTGNGEKIVNPSYPITKLHDYYYQLIKILFKQPQKTILNNLRRKNESADALARTLKNLGIDPADRPQDLSVGTIIKLSEVWYTQNRR